MSYAVITGASSGIGKEFAVQLAKDGQNLLLIARRAEKLTELATELQEKYGISAEILPADLSDPAQIDTVASTLADRADIAYLINNAGFGTKGMMWEADDAKQRQMMNLHMLAPYAVCRAIIPQMIQNKSGTIINVSSIAGFVHSKDHVNYSATKAYLTSFSKSLQDEVGEYNIQVQALCPGYTYSGFHDTADYDNFERSTVPDKMWMSAEEVVTESLQSIEKGKVVVIPGSINQGIVLSSKLPIFGALKKFYKKYITKESA